MTTQDTQTAATPSPRRARLAWLWAALIALSVVVWGAALWVRAASTAAIAPAVPATSSAGAGAGVAPTKPAPTQMAAQGPGAGVIGSAQPPPPGALPGLCADPEGTAAVARWREAVAPAERAQWEAWALSSGCAEAFSDDERDALLKANAAWILTVAEQRGVTVSTPLLLEVLSSPRTPWTARAAAAASLKLRLRAKTLEDTERARLLEVAPLLWASYLQVQRDMEAEAKAAAQAAKPKPKPKKPKPKPRRPGLIGDLAFVAASLDAASTWTWDATLDAQARSEEPLPPPTWWEDGSLTLARIEAKMLPRWQALPQEARDALMERWLSARWWMHKAGSATQPQVLLLEVSWRGMAMPAPFTDSVLYGRVVSVTIEDEQDKKPQPVEASLPLGDAKDLLGWMLLEGSTSWQRAVDLQPLLDAKGAFKVAAELELVLLPADARQALAEVVDSTTGALSAAWQAKALWTRRVAMAPMTYKVYLGADSGEPKTTRDAKAGRQLSQRLAVTLHTADGDVALRRDGKATRHPKDPYPLRHSPVDALGLTLSEPIGVHLSFRLYGLPNDDLKAEWIDLGGGVLKKGDLDARWPVNLSAVCPIPGPCKAGLRLRASLKTARFDPRIDRYWGDPIELGALNFMAANSGDGQHWRGLQQRLAATLGASPDVQP